MARNILVVEDDRNISDLIRMYLEKEGFDVRIAYDGGKAVEEYDRQAPDMVLLDIMLPVMDGWSVCAHIREKAKTPIIMLTAKSEVNDRITGLEMGADDYLVKPFEMKELMARINAVLRRSEILQRDIEPGLAGVTLTAGTATQLVVDPAGVVALGTHDEQAAGLTHLLRLSGDLLLVLLQLLGKQAAGIQNLLVVRLGVAGGLSNEFVRQPCLPQVTGGHVLGVAAQHDIRTTAGHVGGHGDGAQLTGLRHDLRLTLVVLGVQYVVLDARLGEHPA